LFADKNPAIDTNPASYKTIPYSSDATQPRPVKAADNYLRRLPRAAARLLPERTTTGRVLDRNLRKHDQSFPDVPPLQAPSWCRLPESDKNDRSL
jgi:hypothetical protein